MKATLSFDLPEERSEHLAAVQGADWRNVVWQIDQTCRNWIKYGNELKNAENALEAVRARITEETEARNLSLDEFE